MPRNARLHGWLLGTGAGLATSILVAGAAISLPHVFNKGDPISASAFNENFQALAAGQSRISGDLQFALSGEYTVARGATSVTVVNGNVATELQVGDAIKLGDHVTTVSAIADDMQSLTLAAPHPEGALSATAYSDSDLLRVATGDGRDKLRIDKSGVLSVAEIHLVDMAAAGTAGFASITQGANIYIDNTAGGQTYINYRAGNGLYVGGGNNAPGTVTASKFSAVSARRFKQEIAASDYGLREISRLQPVTFAYSGDPQHRRQIGLLADDVLRIIPEVVDQDPRGNAQSMDYSRLTVVLINAVKQLEQENIALARRVQTLEQQELEQKK